MISVIIPAHNEQDFIRETLEAVCLQKGADYEVAVIANCCSDRTVAIAKRFPVEVLQIEKKGSAHAKNIGAIRYRDQTFFGAEFVITIGETTE